MLSAMSPIQAFYYGAFVQGVKCHEETEGDAFGGYFVRRMGEHVEVAMAPPSIQSTHSYYYENVEKQDWGGVSLYKVLVDDVWTYAVHTTCDGDEQWLEIYDEDGVELGFAMIYVDNFKYTDKQTLRTYRIDV
ncbi:MAG: hypothetical protein AAF702_04730 [Chloroflexota bacterium]